MLHRESQLEICTPTRRMHVTLPKQPRTTSLHKSQQQLGNGTLVIPALPRKTQVQIFTAYQVSQSSSKGLGLRTAYMQQQRAMNNAGIRGISPRTKMLQDLAETIAITHSESTDVIILMDSNAETSEAHLSNFLATTGLHTTTYSKYPHDGLVPDALTTSLFPHELQTL